MLQFKKRVHSYGTKTVKFSNKDLDDMTKIVKALEDLSLMPMLLGTLGASFLTRRGMYRVGNRGQGLFRAGQGNEKKSLTRFHPLTNFEIQEYFKDEKRFNGVYSRNNLPKLKNGAYVINLDHSKNI